MPPRRSSPRDSREAGWTVLARNVHVGRHELDLVAVDPGPPAALVVVEVRWRAGRGLRPARGDRRPPQARPRPARRRTACSTAASLPDGSPCRGCRCGSTWSSSSPGDRRAPPPARHADRAGRSASNPTRATLPPGPGPARATPNRSPAPRRRGAHTRTVPTGTVPAGPTGHRPPATRSAEERNRQEVAHRAVRFDAAAARGRSPLRPPDPPLEPQDDARSSSPSATGSTSSTWPRPSSAWTSPSSSSARPSPAATRSSSSGTKKQAQEPVAQEATRANQPYVNKRWLGGMLTNFVTIKKRIGLLEQLEARQRPATSSG